MGRERARITKRLEKNPAVECNRIQRKFYPELLSKFEKTKDPRHSSYIEYSNKEMLGTLYYKALAEIESMQEMTREFNSDKVVNNLYHFMGNSEKEYLPHHVTLNEYLERLEPAELEAIRNDIAYQMIRRKTFDDAKVFNGEGYAAVKRGTMWGFINKDGEMIIEPMYEDARSFSNGYAAVKMNGKWGFINTQNELKIDYQFTDAKDFNEGGCVLVKGDKWQMLHMYLFNF